MVDREAAVLLREVWKSSNINRWFTTPDPDQVDPVTLDIDLRDAPGLRVISQREDLEIIDRPEDQSDADAAISTDPSLFALLVTARANLETAIEEGRASVAGDRNAARWFNNWFQGS